MKRGLALVAVFLAPGVAAAEGKGKDICYDYTEVNVPDGSGGSLSTSWFGIKRPRRDGG